MPKTEESAVPFKILFVAGALLLPLATTATSSQSWGPKVSYYNGILRVSGYGTFYNDANARAANQMTVADKSNDGNAVYGKTVFRFWVYNSLCSCTEWRTKASLGTGEWQNTTRTVTVKTGLDGAGSRARGDSYVCAQMGWPVPNSCSSASYPTFDY